MVDGNRLFTAMAPDPVKVSVQPRTGLGLWRLKYVTQSRPVIHRQRCFGLNVSYISLYRAGLQLVGDVVLKHV